MKLSIKLAVAVTTALLITFIIVRILGLGKGVDDLPLVVYAANDIEGGVVINKSDLKVGAWVNHDPPAASFSSTQDLDGRVTKQKIFAGDILLNGKLAPRGATSGLTATIEPGKRAITVRVNDVIGVAGFTLPGNYVDVLVSIKEVNQGQSFSRVVLNRVKVLAIAQETQADTSKPKVVNAVTLELSPDEAEKLDLARNLGNLSLALRNENDLGVNDSKGARLSDLSQRGVSPVTRQSNGTGAASEIRGLRQLDGN